MMIIKKLRFPSYWLRKNLIYDNEVLGRKELLIVKHYSKCKYLSKPHTNIVDKLPVENLQLLGFEYRLICSLHSILQPIFKRSYCSNPIREDEINGKQKELSDIELKRITELFPQPRPLLNELSTKTPNKIFDIHFKQNTTALKGNKGKKKIIQNDWTCMYTFVWPETRKFESTALSKRQAAEKAATQALQWLYKNKHIDEQGNPVYNNEVLDKLQNSLNNLISVTVSDQSIKKIDEIWNDYQAEIRNIYEGTFEKAKGRLVRTPAALTKDSTLDEEAETSEDVNEIVDEEVSETQTAVHPVYGRIINPPSEHTLQKRQRNLMSIFQRYEEVLTPLPIDEYANEITSTLDKSRVVVIVGAAGCGKSTRAPAAILRRCGVNSAIIVSEPRRVAAIGLAERVASELGEAIGESVGYQVRLHSKLPRPPAGSILYCTSGVLLRRLQSNPGLKGCSHVIIDEAHERDVNTDITLLLLKRAMAINPELKVLVMSATLDTEVFTRYFDSCPVIEVPGRTFPVDIYHLDDIQRRLSVNLPITKKNCSGDSRPNIVCQEIVEVIKAVDAKEAEGAILVFLPGWAEIKFTKQLLDEHYGGSCMHLILPVHSRLSTIDQKKMFAKPMAGVRKIVLATNIAETSITIPDVVYVIDSGSHKENTLREGTGTASLETVWVSQAGAKQRTGRAGRVQEGKCFRLYTKEKEAEFIQHTKPEILRIPLEQTVLDCKTYAPDDKVENFLSQLPEPPSKTAIQHAVKDLVDLGALTPKEELTRLGDLVSRHTVHPRLAASLIYSVACGTVLPASIVATHCGDNVELFHSAADRRDEIREIKSKFNPMSDHSALYWIQQEFEQTLASNGWQATDAWCERFGLRKDRLKFVKSISNIHMEQLLKSAIIEPVTEIDQLNSFSDIDELIAGTLLSGSNSLLMTKRKVKTKGKLKTSCELYASKGDKAHIGSESVNYGITKRSHKTNLLTYFGGYHSTERRALVLYKTSLITPHMALLFCKGSIRKEIISDKSDETTVLSMPRHKLKIQMPTRDAQALLRAKEMLWSTFGYFIERDLKNVDYNEVTSISKFRSRLMKVVGRVLVESNREYLEGKSAVVYEGSVST